MIRRTVSRVTSETLTAPFGRCDTCTHPVRSPQCRCVAAGHEPRRRSDRPALPTFEAGAA